MFVYGYVVGVICCYLCWSLCVVLVVVKYCYVDLIFIILILKYGNLWVKVSFVVNLCLFLFELGLFSLLICGVGGFWKSRLVWCNCLCMCWVLDGILFVLLVVLLLFELLFILLCVCLFRLFDMLIFWICLSLVCFL